MRICSLYGAAYFYIPGTDQCVNASTGETRRQSEYGVLTSETALRRNVDRALEGVAITTALPTAIVESGKSFAIAGSLGNFWSTDWGAFGGIKPAGFSGIGFNALGVGAAARLNDQWQLNGAVSVSASGKSGASRVGFNYSW